MADVWHYTSEGKRMEPVTTGELRQLAGSGYLRPDDLVWKEGMTDWVPASRIRGLFPNAPAAARVSAPPAFTPTKEPPVTFEADRPARRRRPDFGDTDPPRRRRRSEDDEDAPRRRRPQKSSGSSLALILGLIGGGVLVLIVIVVIIAVAVGRGSFGSFTASIPGGGIHTHDFSFKANIAYEFVLSSNPVSDVDIYVTDVNDQILQSGNLAAADITVGPNGRIVWVFPVAGVYRVKVHNLGPRVNRSTVTIRELGPNRQIEVPFAAIPPVNMPIPQPKILPPAGPVGAVGPPIAVGAEKMQRTLPMLGLGQQCEFTVTYPIAKQVTVDVTTLQRDTDVDLMIVEVGGPRQFSDTSIGPDSHVTFPAQAGKTYRFQVQYVGMGRGTANSTITYTAP